MLQEFRQTLAALQGVLGELAARPAAGGGSVFSPPAASTVSVTVRPTPQRSSALCSAPGACLAATHAAAACCSSLLGVAQQAHSRPLCFLYGL
jgi:hypothetical protein